jgi:hypothetical protein
MLLVYMLLGAIGFAIIVLGYGRLVGSRNLNTPRIVKKPYPDLWLVSLLDCEYSPTKQSYGPARILPATKVNLQPIAKGCENC